MKCFTLCVFAALISGHTFAQEISLPRTMTPGLNQPGTTLQQVVNNLNVAILSADTGEGGYVTQLNNFQKFWMARAVANDSTANDSTKTNMFSQYFTALRRGVAERELATCGTSGYHGAWQVFGPDTLNYQAMGYVTQVWANPINSNTILAATIGGLFKTIDGGKRWFCISDQAPVVTGITGVSVVAVNPLDTNTIFVGTAGTAAAGIDYGAGILESFDGGATWQQEFIPTGGSALKDSIETISALNFSPDSTRLYAICNGKVYTRYNIGTGNPWVDITPSDLLPHSRWYQFAFAPSTPNHFFLTNIIDNDLPNAGIWESQVAEPHGSDWTRITAGLTDTVGGSIIADTAWLMMDMSVPTDDTLFFIAFANTASTGNMYKVNIDGALRTITPIKKTLPFGWIVASSYSHFHLLVSPAATDSNNGHKVIYFCNDVPYASYDGGQNFIQIGTYTGSPTHGDIRSMYLQSATNSPHGKRDILILGTDGGVSEKQAGTDVATSLAYSTININGKGLTCGQFWSVATSEEGELAVGGMQHDGLVSYEHDANPPWQADPNGASDASICVFDNFNRKVAYGLSNNSFLYPEGRAYTYPYGLRTLGEWGGYINAPIVFHPPTFIDNFNTQYIGETNLWQKLNSESGFYPICSELPNIYGQMNAMCINPYLRTVGVPNPTDTLPIGYVAFTLNPNELYRRLPFTGLSTFDSVAIPTSYPITGIAMNATIPTMVWVSLGGVDSNTTATNRVLVSIDAGNHWYDVSYGLPPHVPVTNIIYQEGSGLVGVLFCATEVGIYRCDFGPLNELAPHMGVEWECFNNGAPGNVDFPNAYVTDLKINYCEGKLYAATYGRSIWNTDINPPGTLVNPTTIISTNTTWSGGNQYMTGSIDVQPGVIFTIDNFDTVHMPKGGAIIVEPGAHLSVDHAMITNDCDQCFWQGIQVLGDNSLPQYPTSNQGYVNINSSTLQHAVMAVSNAGPVGINAGGVIIAFNNNFINNQNSVTLWPFTNYSSGVVAPYLAHFVNNTFLLDTNYKGNKTGSPAFSSHVSLTGVDAVSFGGNNQFLNRDTFSAFRLKGDGIYSYNASFGIGGVCSTTLLCYPLLVPRFCGFTNGIEIKNDILYNFATGINLASFDSVSVGVNITGNNNVVTTQCKFKVGNGLSTSDLSLSTVSLCSQNIGILLQNIDQFWVEGNDFEGTTPPTYWYNFGVAAVNTQSANQVYRNTFNSLSYGVYALGVNKSGFPSDGLKILCNGFSGSGVADIFVDPGAPPYYSLPGIAYFQGSPTTPAGNTFSGSAANIIDTTTSGIEYYYDASVAAEKPTTVSAIVSRYPIPYAKSCASTFDIPAGAPAPPVGTLSAGHLRQHKDAFYADRTTYRDTLAVYNSLIDFGNTDSLIAVIDSSTDTTTLYSILSGGSPYISEAALNAVGSGGELPYYSMMLLLKQNPDDLHDGSFLANMQVDYSLDTADMDTLIATAATMTSRTYTEGSMAAALSGMAVEANRVMTALKLPTDTSMNAADTTWPSICTDSTSVYYMLDSNAYYAGFDSIDVWLQNIGSLWTYYDRVGYYNFRKDVSTASRIFSGTGSILPAGSQPDSATYVTYGKLWSAIKSAESHGRSIYSLDSTEIASLDTSTVPVYTYNTARKLIYAYSLSLLGGTGGIGPGHEAFLAPCAGNGLEEGRPGHSGTNYPPPITSVNGNKNQQFSAYPNPTSGVVTFAYNVPDAVGAIKIVITNIVGEVVKELHSANRTGNMNWDTKGLAAGVYIYQASSEQGIISKGKLVVTP